MSRKLRKSAGILPYRKNGSSYEILLVFPGGPYSQNKGKNIWSVAKGEFVDEDPLDAAIREFKEETGIEVNGQFIRLDPVKQSRSKKVYCWAIEKDFDVNTIKSNYFNMEWPTGSGNLMEFLEVEQAAWFTFETARVKILTGQIPILEQLEKMLGDN